MQSSPLRRKRAFRILQWITAANRPLNLTELDFALGIQVDSELSPKVRSLMRGEMDVVNACGSFVEITKAGQIRFVHASAKEFLSSRGVQFGNLSSLTDPLSPSQKVLEAMYIAKACITCLSFSDITLATWTSDSQSLESHVSQLSTSIEQYPFLGYAVMNWWKHLSAVPDFDAESLQYTIRRFLGSSENTISWLYLYHYQVQFRDESALLDLTTMACWKHISLFWKAHLGPNPDNLFSRWQRWHIEFQFNRGVFWPPLHISAFFNFADMVQQELARGVPPDLQNGPGFNPLMQAAHGDSPEAAQMLIDHGANLEARTRKAFTATRYACRNSLSTLLLLLKAGGRADQLDWIYSQTPLHEIASSVLWHPGILNAILALPYISEIINKEDDKGRTALSCAVAIDVPASAARIHDKSFDGMGGAKILDGSIIDSFRAKLGASHLFSAHGAIGLGVLHKEWCKTGVYTRMDFTYESIFASLAVWKAEIIRKLQDKGAT